MGEWYSALGGGVALNGHEIYRRIRAAGDTSALGMAASASWELADRYGERVTGINALTQKMDAAWQGAASAGAASAMRPVAKAFEDAQSLLTTSRDALADQAHGYWRAFREVEYVPPTKDLFDGFGPESDIDRAIAEYNDKAQRNVMIYNGYYHQSVANGDRMPVSYPTVLSVDGPSVTVSGDGWDPTADHRSDGGRPGTDPDGAAVPSTGSGAADTDGQPVPLGTVVPVEEGGPATRRQSWEPQGTLMPSGQAGGVPAEPRPGGSGGWGPGASAGWGPGGSVGPGGPAGWGPGGSVGPGRSAGWGPVGSVGPGRSAGWGPDARGGVGPVPPSPGGVVGRPAPDGRGGLPRGGRSGWPETRTQLGGEALRPATGTGGGSALGGGMWNPYPSRFDDDPEHYRRYGRQSNSEDLFGIDVAVAPSVIGAEPVDGDEDGEGYWFGYGDTDEN